MAAVTIQKLESGTLTMSEDIAKKLFVHFGFYVEKHMTDSGQEMWSLTSMMMRGDKTLTPYTYADFIHHEARMRILDSFIEEGSTDISHALDLILHAATRSNQLSVLIVEIENSIVKWIHDFKLEPQLDGLLREKGFDESTRREIISLIKDSPLWGSINYFTLCNELPNDLESSK